ncbi:MBL fold metallo-hydrolase [Ktedonosporobacter rubrisoli]|uniref:MBL fold metallo-hydrolase n=1 Tax=Ktedonosporobacter rubrisoli TaxID=2509675 RepID=A0A4P6JJ64_KTERU|nr:MBL fold metallo-hydrolase [Ktedonosporobacter rubrisoli]QBD75128.1 MBL fold metallo-hydrolase [Ktedonosporobacter rubrisoli]
MNLTDHSPYPKASVIDEAPRPQMRMIAHHVWQLYNRFPANLFNVYLIEDVLVDAATRWDASSLLKQLTNIPLSQVALTHCHPDHQGAVKQICMTRGVPLACPEGDVASMEGHAPMVPGTVAIKIMQLGFAGPAYAVQRCLHDGDEIAGFRVIHTPGHTPGHVIHFRESDRVALVGDVLRNNHPITGKTGLYEPPDVFTLDREENRRSIRKLAQLRPALLCFGHGPVLYDMEQLDRFVARLPS